MARDLKKLFLWLMVSFITHNGNDRDSVEFVLYTIYLVSDHLQVGMMSFGMILSHLPSQKICMHTYIQRNKERSATLLTPDVVLHHVSLASLCKLGKNS